MTYKQLKDFCLEVGYECARNGEPYPNKTAIEISAKYGLTGHVFFKKGYDMYVNLSMFVASVYNKSREFMGDKK